MVAEEYQGLGIGTYLLNYLIELGKEQGHEGMKADVVSWNEPMLKILNRLPYVIHHQYQGTEIAIRFRFDELKKDAQDPA